MLCPNCVLLRNTNCLALPKRHWHVVTVDRSMRLPRDCCVCFRNLSWWVFEYMLYEQGCGKLGHSDRGRNFARPANLA